MTPKSKLKSGCTRDVVTKSLATELTAESNPALEEPPVESALQQVLHFQRELACEQDVDDAPLPQTEEGADEPVSRLKLIGFSKTLPGDFERAHPQIELPVSAPRRDFRALQAFGDVQIPDFCYKQAWRFVLELSFTTMYSIALTKIQFDLEAGVQTLLAGLFAAAANICDDFVLLKREMLVSDNTHGGPIEYVFVDLNGIIRLIVEIKRDLRATPALTKKYLQQLYHELHAAWHMNQQKNNDVLDVAGVLMDADGAVIFRLHLEPTGTGKVTCTPYMYVYTGCSPSQHLPLFILHLLHNINPTCCQWDEQEWQRRFNSIQSNETHARRQALKVADVHAEGLKLV